MLRRIARVSAPFTLIVPAALAWLGGCGGSDVTVAVANEAGAPPSFTAPDAEVQEEAGLTSYCPTNKCPSGWTTCSTSRFPCDVNLQRDVNNCGACGRACPPGSVRESFACIDGACVAQCIASSARLDCDGLADNGCETYKGNNNHCGACGKKCSDPAKPCMDQTGEDDFDCGCPADQLLCGWRCADSKNDDNNCGTCGTQCDATNGGAPAVDNAYYGCENGECGALKCNKRFANCDDVESNGCETSLLSDANCGACGNACPDGQACRLDGDQQPQCMCPPGKTYCQTVCYGNDCLGACVDLTSSLSHCGACGAGCPSNGLSNSQRTCSYGTCVMRCNQGQADCNNSASDGCEVNTDSDPRNCGGCGIGCDAVAGQACVAGRCVVEPCGSEGGGGTAR
jgi:hypothetical protein